MKNVILIGKQKGEYEGNAYFQLFFTESVNEKNGEGSKPYLRQNGSTADGRLKFSHAIGCTVGVYDFLQVGESLDADTFLFNSKGKLASIDD